MLALAATEPEVALRGGDFDRDPWLLNVANGTLDLRTGALRLHRPEDQLTKVAPVAYDAAATAPRWERFLREVTGDDPAMIAFLQRSVGYGLTGNTGEECVFFLYGTGANGKTKFLETLRALLGDYALNANFAMLLDMGKRSSAAASPDIARLRGARFVTAVEAPGGKPFDETVVKQIVGGDTLTARHLYHEEFEFVPAFKLFLAANHKPPVREQTEGFWRRMRLVPFTVTIPEEARDPELLAKLKAELPGILNWALAGCAAWRESGLQPPAVVMRATAAYREENDVIAEWIAACAIMDPTAWTANGDLYKSYVEWRYQTYGNEDRPLNPTWFGRLLGERPDLIEEKRGQRGRRGIRLVNPLGAHF
jgi:putative DNA primase/helicase